MKRNETAQAIPVQDGPLRTLTEYKRLSLALIVLTVLAAGIMYAEPIKDGDLWFHLAYARYMVQNHTLVPDHTAFSWTPSDGSEIYCAWLSEIFLNFLYEKGGTTLLFILRYACIALFILLVFLFARKRRAARHPLTWLVCLAGLMMSPAGVHVKPEIFSYVLMTLAVYLWWSIKSPGQERWRLCYLFPVLLLVWANSHGGVIFGMTFLGTLFAGEVINGLISRKEALAPRLRKHFFAALALCVPILLITPYGWEYPVQLVQNFIVHKQGKIDDFMTVSAYQTIFHPMALGHHFVEYLAFACLTLVALLLQRIRDRRLDWTLVVMNLVFAFLYIRFIRVTYFWAIVFTFSAVHLLGERQDGIWEKKGIPYRFSVALILALFLFLSGRAAYESLNKPLFGFRINYVNPVEEAEFIRKNLSGLRMGNDYESGSYLLWALGPQTKVFIDARYFPYKDWYDEYSGFMSGRNVDAFLEKYPCDFWVFTYDFPGIAYFLKSGDWRLVHYGPSACIFIDARREPLPGAEKVSVFRQELTVYQAVKVLEFTLAAGDIETARGIVDKAVRKDYLLPQKKALSIEAHIKLGSALERRGLIDESIGCFQDALAIDQARQEIVLKLGDLYQKKGDLNSAAERYAYALFLRPQSAEALGRLAIVASLQGRLDESLEYLFKLLAFQPESSDVYYNIACIYAKQGKAEMSVAWLEKAIGKGFKDWSLLKSDPDLGNIRGTRFFMDYVRNLEEH